MVKGRQGAYAERARKNRKEEKNHIFFLSFAYLSNLQQKTDPILSVQS